MADNLTQLGRGYYAASTLACVPSSLAQDAGLALGAQAGEARLGDVLRESPRSCSESTNPASMEQEPGTSLAAATSGRTRSSRPAAADPSDESEHLRRARDVTSRMRDWNAVDAQRQRLRMRWAELFTRFDAVLRTCLRGYGAPPGPVGLE